MSPAKPLSTLPLLLPLILALQTLSSASPILTLRPRQSSQPVFGTERYRRSPSSGQLSAADHLRARLPSSASLALPQLYSTAPRLRPILTAPTFRQWDPVDPYRAFVEQELLEQPDQGGLQDSLDDAYYAEGPYEGRAATRMSTDAGQSPFVLSPGYLQYNPAVSAFRPAAASWRSQERWRGTPGDPVDDLEEEMRREEDSMGWGTPRWTGDDSGPDADEEDEDLEAEEEAEAEAEAAAEEAERRRQAEEEAERAKTEGAFLRNLILAQRYREDALSQPEASLGEIGGRKAYRLSGGSKRTSSVGRRPHQTADPSQDRAVRELESLAGKGSSEKRSPAKGKAAAGAVTTPATPTEAPVRSTSAVPSAAGGSGGQKGQKEVAVPRPASPPRRPPVESVGVKGGKWENEALVAGSSKSSVLEALERLLEQEREPLRHRLVGSGHLQKRFASGEDIMLRQLNELKRA